MSLWVNEDWEGWDGETIVELTDGTFWRQTEYHYEYRYAYRPSVHIKNSQMMVEGMSRAVRVEQISASRGVVASKWTGWKGKTELELTDGSRWQQAEHHYEYRYAHRPSVLIFDGMMLIDGMSKPIRVKRIPRQ